MAVHKTFNAPPPLRWNCTLLHHLLSIGANGINKQDSILNIYMSVTHFTTGLMDPSYLQMPKAVFKRATPQITGFILYQLNYWEPQLVRCIVLYQSLNFFKCL